MIFRSPWRAANGLACSLLILVATAIAAQRLTPTQEKQKWSRVAKQVCQMIEAQHISQSPIDDSISIKTLDQLLKDLDAQKMYFLKSDIEEFNKSRTDLDDQLKAGNLQFGFDVYRTYLKRISDQIETAQKLIDAPHDFTVNETMPIDPKDFDWAADKAALDERWRKRIKYDLVLLKLDKTPDAEAHKRLHTRYRTLQNNISKTEEAEMVEAYLTSLCMAFDPHSSYMSPRNSNEFEVQMKLRLDGIGAALKSEDGYTVVAQIVPGGAAAEDGRLKVGDKIIGVSNEKGELVDVNEMKLTQVVDLIRGPKGTQVSLQVIKAGATTPTVYDLKRKTIELKQAEVKGEIIETEKRLKGTKSRVGVIHVPSFYRDFQGAESGDQDFKSTSRDVRNVLKDFKKRGGVDAVVIDLRTNGGGALAEAIEVTGLFIDLGPVVQVKTQRGKVKQLVDEEEGVEYKGPLVVLTNRLSASASEIFAGAIKDYGRGLIVGDRTTHGKGTVQSVMNVNRSVFSMFDANPPSEGALKLTIQQFYRVNGASTQNLGVPSDVVLPSLLDNMDLGEQFLDNAMKYDQIKATPHDNWELVSVEMKSYLQEASRKRVSADADFHRTAKDIERYLARKQRKSVTLKEDDLRKERIEEEQKTREKADQPDDITEGPVYPVNSYNTEALAITLDYMDMLKQRATAGK